jgi:hypothetical protein
MTAWAALNGTVTTLAQMTGSPIEDLIVVSDSERARSAALSSGCSDPFRLVNALALDPWNAGAQEALARALSAPAGPAPPALDGVRSFATLAFARELVASPEMLTAYGRCFGGDDDATLVVFGSLGEIDALGAALDAAGLGGDSGPDMLAVTEGAPAALAPVVGAVFSRLPQDGVLASVPRVDDARAQVLRDLARDAAAAAAAPA